MEEQAEYKLFMKIPEEEPRHIKRVDWICIQCGIQYYMYLTKDGDICFGCPNCGLYQEISGPWIIWN
jgi:hypothetical protein